VIATILAAVLALAPAPPPFDPFYVGGPAYPLDMPDVYHVVIWADTPDEGTASCLEEWSYNPPGARMDCRVEPSTIAPDPTQPGWALPYGPGGDSRG
jgi:hypothetical protein